MASHNTIGLVGLAGSGRMLADPAEDIRDRKVRDCDGDDLGTVEDLLIDDEQGKVRMLRVEHGGFLGIGATASFVPVDLIARIEDDTVYVSASRDRVAEAPRYDPELVEEADYYDSLYGYYGYTPYWGAGYVSPGFPYHRA